jgi:transglutaminase-like putative cysteine protease
MNHRLTIAAGVAVVLASVSEFSLIRGGGWLVEIAGAVLVVALAGTLTRLDPVVAGIGATVLGAAAAAPLLATPSPFGKVAAAAIVGLCAASTSGLRPLRAIAGLVTYLAALLLYVNAVLASGQSLAAVIPTTASVHHLVALGHAGAALTKYPPPVSGGNHGVQYLAISGIGLAAIVVDFVAVRLRRPAVAGLPLLVIYLAPIATTANVGGLTGAVAFLLAAAGYLAMLSSDGRSRLRGWGRVVTVWHATGEDDRLGGADVGELTATGRRIGLAAVCTALVIPLLLPTLSPHRILGGGSGTGPGTTVGLPDPVDQLHGLLTRSKPLPVLTYQTTAPNSGNYLQVYVLNYDRALSQWDIIRPRSSTTVGDTPLQPAPGLTSATPRVQVTSTITLGHVVSGYSGQVFFLPVPYWPTHLSIQGGWHEATGTLMIYADGGNHQGQRYTVTNGEINPSPGQLAGPQAHIPAAIRKNFLAFPSPLAAQLKAIAERVTQGQTSTYAKALALERWFHSGRFVYNLRSTNIPNTPQGLLAFLTSNRQGYCQQFAFAMAVLARLLKIPSRVAIGYTAGTRRADGSWLVTTRDAHAWPELYFAGAGWVRFEPTPGGSTGQDTAVEPPWVTAANQRPTQTGPKSGGITAPPTAPPRSVRPSIPVGKLQQNGDTAGGAQHQGIAIAGLIALAFLALLVLTTIAPATARLVVRRRRWRLAGDDASLARAAWQEFCADLEDYGMACKPSESPRTVARRVIATADLDDAAGRAVVHIATVVERARYAPAPHAAGAIRADVTVVRRSLARGAGRAARWRARLAPASTLRPVTMAFRQGLGLLTGWTPAAGEGAF